MRIRGAARRIDVWIHNLGESEGDVGGGEWCAVLPGDAVAQVIRDGSAVRTDSTVCARGYHSRKIGDQSLLIVELDEAIENRFLDGVLVCETSKDRIQRVEVVWDCIADDAVNGCGLHAGMAARAHSTTSPERQQKRQKHNGGSHPDAAGCRLASHDASPAASRRRLRRAAAA